MTTMTIELPLPPKAVHPNARSHWAAKARAKKQQRSDATTAALAALNGARRPRWGQAEVHATFYLARKTDPDNLIAWMKASLDGLQDAGIIANDNDLMHLSPAQVLDPKRSGKRGLVLRVTPVTTRAAV